jgi:hypothetical protein
MNPRSRVLLILANTSFSMVVAPSRQVPQVGDTSASTLVSAALVLNAARRLAASVPICWWLRLCPGRPHPAAVSAVSVSSVSRTSSLLLMTVLRVRSLRPR